MTHYIAALDQGTTGSRCVILDGQGYTIASAYREHRQIYPQPGWVEHDPLEILANVYLVLNESLHMAGLQPADLAGIGIANQRETVVVWNRHTGQPYANAVVWQCVRSRDICAQLERDGKADLIRRRTGLVIATYFSASKLAWLLRELPELARDAQSGDALAGTIDSWLAWNLTGEHITDVTNASRTMLMNLETLAWDAELCELFGIPMQMLPRIVPSLGQPTMGMTADGIPLRSILGDQQAALVGQTCFEVGEAKNTYGTGSFMLMNIGSSPVISEQGLLTTVAYGLEPGLCRYALEGSIAVTGAAVQWLRDNLGLIHQAADIEALAAEVPDNGGVYFVPAFAGMYAPRWDMDARGLIIGLTRYATKAHLARATLEAIAHQTQEVLQAMGQATGIPLSSLRVDGGASANNLLMQIQADILGKPVIRPVNRETTSLGAAYLAGMAAGIWLNLEALRALWRSDRIYQAQWSAAERERGWRMWQRAADRAQGWAEPLA
ncbi:MAG: glycerol kinase GlpK [Chloroflexi bacterium]|nr:glycerol kinase GlpK [Chloroflexota bacterium]